MKKYNYIFTKHALKRIKERNISVKEVEKTLEHPDMTYPGKRGEINIIKQIKEDKKIRIVCKDEKTTKIIITAIVINE